MEPSDASPGANPGQIVGLLVADRFRVLRLVSEGANSWIYDASDDDSGRPVTLKLVVPAHAASPSFRTRFDETMRSVAALTHPNIAAVYDWGIAPVGDVSTAYVVVEQLLGGSLRDMFDRGRQLTPSQALVVGLDACRGLDHAHRRGFVHTELNPSKLVFGHDRRLRIVDFGLAQLLGEPAWRQPDSVANHVAWYAAPEQGLGRPVTGKADVYALCLSLHEAVTGVLPFKSDSTVAALAMRVGKLMPVSADLGPLAKVFEQAGRPEADERSSAAEFGKGLVQAASKLPRPTPLPILSTALFETPPERMRAPDDPTGGVTRPSPVVVVPVDAPSTEPDSVNESAPGPVGVPGSAVDVVEPQPALGGDDLVILPLDADVEGVPAIATAPPSAPPPIGSDVAYERRPEPTKVLPATAPVIAAAAPGHRGFPWKIVLGVLVIAALVTLGVLATRLFTTPTAPVPDLTGVPEAEALNLIAGNDWVVSVERERSDDVAIVGQVVRTVPGPGIELAQGEPFLMVVSEGPTLRPLPDSTGRPVSEAQTELVELGLDVRVVDQHDEQVPVGTVISWSVPADPTLSAGSMVEPLTTVELVVSTGPAPRVVPDVTLMAAADARVALESIQLVYAEGEPVFHETVQQGAVVSQDIAPAAEVERGSTVTVVLSKGRDVVAFPDLAGAPTYAQADPILRAAGFTPNLVLGSADAPIQSMSIGGEPPVVGQTYPRGTQVDVVAF